MLGLGNGNLLIIIEKIAQYIGEVLRRLGTDNIRTIEPKASVVKSFTDYCDAYFKRTVSPLAPASSCCPPPFSLLLQLHPTKPSDNPSGLLRPLRLLVQIQPSRRDSHRETLRPHLRSLARLQLTRGDCPRAAALGGL